MKNIMKISFVAALITIASACKDDNDTIRIEEHDSNQMMSIMHNMMLEMDAMEMTMDPDHDFAMMMKMHHQGAIDMSNAELKDGKDPEMKQLAQQIIEEQQSEIAELDAFLSGHSPHLMSMDFHDMMMMEMKKSAKQKDLQIINGDIDHDFAILMIGHHHSAIENSRLELLHGHETSMKDLANRIIAAQIEEIDVLQEWLLKKKNQ